jgi:HlyD family secretion protein
MKRRIQSVLRRRWVAPAAGVVLLLAVTGLVRMVRAAPRVPTVEVRRGEFVDQLQLRGEVKAQKSIVLTAPSGAGDIQILTLAKNGDTVKQGDVVVQFDITDLKNRLDTRSSELKQADAEIEGARAQGRMKEEQDLTDLAKAKFDVERARLDAGKQEILSEIDGAKARLKLADAEQAQREAEEKVKSDKAASAADIASRQQKRGKALFDVNQVKNNIARMTLRAPVGGMVTLLQNFRAGSFFAENNPEWKVGDRAWPGAGIAELPDLNVIQIAARVDEIDRGRVEVGQTVGIRVDALPDQEFQGKVVEISPMAKSDFSGWPVVRNFDMRMQIENADSRLKPGMSATARVAVDRLPGAVIIPAEASFQKPGRVVAYVLRGGRFEERAIEIARRSGGQLAVAKGLSPGERVATRDPTVEEKDTRK